MDLAVVGLPGTHLCSLGAFRDTFALVRGQVASLFRARDAVGMQSRVHTLSARRGAIDLSDGRTLAPDGIATGDAGYAVIHVADFAVDAASIDDFLTAHGALIAWLRNQHDRGAIVSATGAAVFLLAEAGLLDGPSVFAPRDLMLAFRRRYPRFRGGDDRRAILEEGRVLAARGIAVEFELMTRLVERTMSPEMAGWLARTTGLDRMAASDLSDDPLVADAQIWLVSRFAGTVRIVDLAAALAVSHQTLIRHFQARLGMSPREYIQHLRVESAKRQLLHTTRPISQIATLVGYDDLKSFRTVFREITGVSASRYRSERGVADYPPE